MKKHVVAGNILLAITIIAICGVLIQGCTTVNDAAENMTSPLQEYKDDIGFDVVYSYQDDRMSYTYYRCRLTDVIYVWRQHTDYKTFTSELYSAGLSVMMDPDTNGPLTYDNWLKRLEAKKVEDNTGTIDIQLVYECSACGKEFKVESRPNYCPGCGEKTEE